MSKQAESFPFRRFAGLWPQLAERFRNAPHKGPEKGSCL